MLDPVQDETVDHRSLIVEALRDGSGQAICLRPPDRHPDHQPQNGVQQSRWQLHDRQSAAGLAEERLRLKQVAAAHAERDVVTGLGQLGCDIAAGVPRSDDEHSPSFDVGRVGILTGVQHLAGELTSDRRDERHGVVAVGDEYAGVGACAAVGRGNVPPADRVGADRVEPMHPRTEDDPVTEVIAVGEPLEVLERLRPAGEVGPTLRHRVATETRTVPWSDQVEAVVVGVPMSTDAFGGLEAVELDARADQCLHRCHAGRARSDDATTPIHTTNVRRFSTRRGVDHRSAARQSGALSSPAG